MRTDWLRFAAAILAGIAAWGLAFFVLAILLARLWPEYGEHGRTWMRDGVFTFDSTMAACNLLLWLSSDMLAGGLGRSIAGRPSATLTLALLITGYLALVHFALNWELFPWWYNLGVVLPAFPATILGGRIAGRWARRSATPASQNS